MPSLTSGSALAGHPGHPLLFPNPRCHLALSCTANVPVLMQTQQGLFLPGPQGRKCNLQGSRGSHALSLPTVPNAGPDSLLLTVSLLCETGTSPQHSNHQALSDMSSIPARFLLSLINYRVQLPESALVQEGEQCTTEIPDKLTEAPGIERKQITSK